MTYREFGKTGIRVSALGFGAMRLPTEIVDGEARVSMEKSLPVILRAFELGVNYIDTAYGYGNGLSEVAVGKALKAWAGKGRIYLATKSPTWHVNKTSDFRRLLEEQLRRLDVPCIDFYHFHSLNRRFFRDKVLGLNLFREARRAKRAGLISHLSFSFHDKPEIMKRIIDAAGFSSVLCQYNILNRENEGAIRYAAEKGLGVVVMGPVGGGRLTASDLLVKGLQGVRTTPELALRFVLSNPWVSTAISGMNTVEMVEENARAASVTTPLDERQSASLDRFLRERRARVEIPCTACEYCLPCPRQVAIPTIFRLMNYATVYGLTEYARRNYAGIKPDEKNRRENADACVNCGLCVKKCPQKIAIPQALKKAHKALG